MDAKPTEANSSRESWQLYVVLAGACLLVVLVPAAVSALHSVYAFDYWVVLSSYLGISWGAPAVFLGIAVSHHAREHGRAHSTRRGVVTAIVTAVVLLVGMSVVGVGLLGTGPGDTGSVDRDTSVATEPATRTPEEVVRASIDSSHPVDDVLCGPSTSDTTFCVVTFEGPSCQFWFVKDGEAKAPLEPIPGASGTRTSGAVSCS